MSSSAVAHPEAATAARPPTNRTSSRSKSARAASAREASSARTSSARTSSARPEPVQEMEDAVDNQPDLARIEQLADLAIGAADIKK